MEFLIFLAATVSRSSISHALDHWTLVSGSAVFYNSKLVLCKSVLPSEVNVFSLPQETGFADLSGTAQEWSGVDSLHLKLSILVTWGIHWKWTLPFQELVRTLDFFPLLVLGKV